MAAITFKLRNLIDNDSTAGDKTAVELDDWKYEPRIQRLVAGTLTSGDTITLQGSFDGTTFFDIQDFTATEFTYLLEGPWIHVRVSKTGTTGVATVNMIG